jgi:hypothetical protein
LFIHLDQKCTIGKKNKASALPSITYCTVFRRKNRQSYNCWNQAYAEEPASSSETLYSRPIEHNNPTA